ncbi:probable Haloacid dehalogenase type II [Nonlabens ulvanivorans]|uniref:Probable Haloacid dehalogenase type II n=1 Tax=Nonlabens ulvanivorans TaxID=906888 RepID=A0A090WI91_NONUL|nr:haloacid dehalogenase type II [Nonlabens ulvanivorans]GAL75104.1 probable Haloacid dehalogenase type II [Nonlabens ulvanivorans]
MEPKIKPKVLFFDVNETLLDLTQMKKQVADALGGNDHLLPLWFTTMLQYSLVMSASGRYEPFGHIGAAALQMVAANHDIKMTEEEARNLVINGLRNLPPHPEVKDALSKLKEAGYTLVSLTNSSDDGVQHQFENAGLNSYFDRRLSIEPVKKFKPFTDTYDWAANQLHVQPEDCMLIAAHGWDVAGALWAGWRAAFVSRPGQQLFPLAPQTEINAPDLLKVADLLVAYH